jgi:hypothetical protein
MVQNEDAFVERAVRNVLDFCDELIAVDHRSRDGTRRILDTLAAEQPGKISVHAVDQAGDSNLLLRPYVGEHVWVFGVDGDELYEPERLAPFRRRLLAREFDDTFLIKGNVLHCVELDVGRSSAAGYLAPPSRSMTKLFNFAALEEWSGTAYEHLYGGDRRLRPGFSEESILPLQEEFEWSHSPFRCLHLCFLPRSSLQSKRHLARRGTLEVLALRPTRRRWEALRAAVGRPVDSPWKLEKYRQGPLVEVTDVAGFFPTAPPESTV